MANNLDVQIILDRSGSMANAWDDTLGGLNEYVKQLASDNAVEAKISLLAFDTKGIDKIRNMASANSFEAVTDKEVFPRGRTPLFDAVGEGINDMRTRLPDRRKALVVITDGYENSSCEHTQASVKAMIEKARQDNWLITYLGADHDAWGQAEGLGFAASYVGQYDKRSTRAAFQAAADNTACFFEMINPPSEFFTDEQRHRMRKRK
ncbi:MAG: vWA domain-containing protein [Pseudomonadota bacterium]